MVDFDRFGAALVDKEPLTAGKSSDRGDSPDTDVMTLDGPSGQDKGLGKTESLPGMTASPAGCSHDNAANPVTKGDPGPRCRGTGCRSWLSPGKGHAPGMTSFGVVSSEAVPPETGKPVGLTRRSLHLCLIADQGNGQGCHRRDAPARCAIVGQYRL
jgi:hypothetical protein